MITVVTAASTYQLTTLASVKTLLSIPTTDTTKDALINMVIDQVSDIVSGICDRVFAKEVVRETLPGTARLRIILSRRPIISVSSVKLYGTVVDPSIYSIENRDAGFLYSAVTWMAEKFAAGWGRTAVSPEVGNSVFEINYTGGFWLPGFTGSPTAGVDILLPKGLEAIVQEMVVSQYRQIGVDKDIQSYSIGDYSVQFRNNANPISDIWNSRLMRYTIL